jgi:alpha-L-fucosidase 2
VPGEDVVLPWPGHPKKYHILAMHCRRRKMLKKAILLTAASLASATANSNSRLWYDQPAERWTDALPIGNGRLGAMIYGRTDSETIQINEESVWSGGPTVSARQS